MDDAADSVELGGDVNFFDEFVNCPLEIWGAKIIQVGGVNNKFVVIG